MRIRHAISLLAICLVFHSASAWSLGLGDARVESFIGQPLQMRIDLLTSPNDDLDSVTARLASAEDFALIGASREAIGLPLRFSVQEGEGDSGAYIRVTSRQSLNDPVLRLVVEVTWSSGRLLREYTVFLDPPTVPSQAPAPVTAQPDRQPQAVEPADSVQQDEPGQVAETASPPPVEGTREDDARPTAEPSTTPADAPLASGEQYGPVRRGDTLWRVATNYVGQSGMDMNQVMLAIQRKNPDAFVDDNINLLMRGATLEMPTADEVEELSRARARELVAQQEAAFRMRSSMASSSTPLLAAESSAETAAATADDAQDAGADASASRLEIVPASEVDLAGEPGTGAVPGGEGSDEVARDLREELARTEEELFSERQQNEYLRDRINELEAQLAEAEGETAGLVADDELASLEDRLETERLAEAEAEAESESESPSYMPSVTTQAPEEDRPWYGGPMIWVIMVVIVVAGIVGWILNRRRGQEYDLTAMAGTGTAASGLRGDAEEILHTLDADRDEEAEEGGVTEVGVSDDEREDFVPEDFEADEDEASEEEEGGPPVVSMDKSRRPGAESDDATLLDENSKDPEIKLDLARAYISMGDKEAARVILDEVLKIGSEQQKSEARSMMDEL